ncbi:MAG TPA: methyltransferase domain-containing protein [Usitatibacter sp.]|jgi:SAM-dependent methyltransferase|nr:methyltransferase domain-containing protein [Usitatibacter sp.]
MANISPESSPDLSTDAQWEAWGRRDPYFGVITQPQFRSGALNDVARREFFDSGRQHAEYVMAMIHKYLDAAFAPRSVLDFGCGVGRVLPSFATLAPEVLGLDVSPSMLAEARRNCDEAGARSVHLRTADDRLTGIDGKFDLVHSYIVLQHVAPERTRVIFASLLERIAPGGVGAVHFAYSKSRFLETHGMAPAPVEPVEHAAGAPSPDIPAAATPPPDPEMQMNPYPMTQALFAMQGAGVHRFHAEFTDHGGELGVFLFFQRPAP